MEGSEAALVDMGDCVLHARRDRKRNDKGGALVQLVAAFREGTTKVLGIGVRLVHSRNAASTDFGTTRMERLTTDNGLEAD